jgi:hypothetical protein
VRRVISGWEERVPVFGRGIVVWSLEGSLLLGWIYILGRRCGIGRMGRKVNIETIGGPNSGMIVERCLILLFVCEFANISN